MDLATAPSRQAHKPCPASRALYHASNAGSIVRMTLNAPNGTGCPNFCVRSGWLMLLSKSAQCCRGHLRMNYPHGHHATLLPAQQTTIPFLCPATIAPATTAPAALPDNPPANATQGSAHPSQTAARCVHHCQRARASGRSAMNILPVAAASATHAPPLARSLFQPLRHQHHRRRSGYCRQPDHPEPIGQQASITSPLQSDHQSNR